MQITILQAILLGLFCFLVSTGMFPTAKSEGSSDDRMSSWPVVRTENGKRLQPAESEGERDEARSAVCRRRRSSRRTIARAEAIAALQVKRLSDGL